MWIINTFKYLTPKSSLGMPHIKHTYNIYFKELTEVWFVIDRVILEKMKATGHAIDTALEAPAPHMVKYYGWCCQTDNKAFLCHGLSSSTVNCSFETEGRDGDGTVWTCILLHAALLGKHKRSRYG